MARLEQQRQLGAHFLQEITERRLHGLQLGSPSGGGVESGLVMRHSWLEQQQAESWLVMK